MSSIINEALPQHNLLETLSPIPKGVSVLPDDVVREIFSYLDICTLAITRRICKTWLSIADESDFMRKAIYEEFAFNSKNWAQWDGGRGILKGLDSSEEHLTLPITIVKHLRLSHNAFPENSIMKTHVLVRMPVGLTIKKLGELAKIHFPNNEHGYRYIWEGIYESPQADEAVKIPVWLLMTRDVLAGSRNQSYAQQKAIVANLNQGQVRYKVPRALEAATCVLAEYVRSHFNTFLLKVTPREAVSTSCKEVVRDYAADRDFQVVVGNFSPDGLCVSYFHDCEMIGVAALRKL